MDLLCVCALTGANEQLPATCVFACSNPQHTHIHTHLSIYIDRHGGYMPRGVLHSLGPADSQVKAHLMPSHLPSVC